MEVNFTPADILDKLHLELLWWAGQVRWVRARLVSWRERLAAVTVDADPAIKQRYKRWIERFEQREAVLNRIGLQGVEYFATIRDASFHTLANHGARRIPLELEASEVYDVVDGWDKGSTDAA